MRKTTTLLLVLLLTLSPAMPVFADGAEAGASEAPQHVHEWSEWYIAAAPTVFSQGIQRQICLTCGEENGAAIAPATPFVAWQHKVSKLPRKQSAQFALNLANGDYVKKWKSSKKKVASVSKNGVVKGKKKGKTKITAYTASGLKISCTVKVVKPSKKKAKKAKSSSGGETVYWTPSGGVYHKSSSCPTLSRSRTIYSGSVEESGKGSACKVCY